MNEIEVLQKKLKIKKNKLKRLYVRKDEVEPQGFFSLETRAFTTPEASYIKAG